MAGTGLGVTLNGAEIQRRIGQLAKRMNVLMAEIEEAKVFMDTWDNAALTAQWNISAGDGDKLRGAVTDMDHVRQVYEGDGTQAAPGYDHRVWMRQIWGMGYGGD